MSEEEEKAIENIKLISIGDFVTWFTTDGIVEMQLSAKIVLNLITKQQKEIEEKDRLIDTNKEEIMYLKMRCGENTRLN